MNEALTLPEEWAIRQLTVSRAPGGGVFVEVEGYDETNRIALNRDETAKLIACLSALIAQQVEG